MKTLERAACGGALLTALALRLHRLGDANVWWDEALAIWAVRDTLGGVTAWTATDVHPPVFFWQLWLWVRLVGEGEFASRTVTALTGVLLVAVAYALGRRVAGAGGGVVAAALTAVAPLLVGWSMELRMYTLAGLFVAIATWCGLAWSAAPRRKILLLGYSAAAWAALHTVYLAGAAVAIVAGAILVGVVAESPRPGRTLGLPGASLQRRRTMTWLAANAGVALLTLPWLAYATRGMSSWSSITTPASVGFVAQLWATLTSTGRTTDIDQAFAPAVAFWLAAGAGLLVPTLRSRALPWPRPRFGIVLLALFVAVPPLCVWAVTQPRSIFYAPGVQARYFVPFAAPALCFVAAAVASAWRTFRPVGTLAAVVVMAVPLWSLPSLYAGRRWHDAPAAMAAAIWSQGRPDDVVVLISGDRYPLWRHVYDRRAPPGSAPEAAAFRIVGSLPPEFPEVIPAVGAPPGGLAAPSDPGVVPVFGAPPPGSLAAPADRPEVVEMPAPGGGPLTDYDWERRMNRLLAAHDRVWLVEIERQLQDPDGLLEEWLAARRTRVLSESYGTDSLHLFARAGTAPSVAIGAPAYSVGPGERNLLWLAPPARVAMPGDQVNVSVAGTSVPAPVSLHLDGDSPAAEASLSPSRPSYVAGTFAGSGKEEPPPGILTRYRAALDVTDRIPAGQYEIHLEGDDAPVASLEVRGNAPPVPLSATGFRLYPPGDAAAAQQGSANGVQLTAIGWGGAAEPGGSLVVDLIWRGSLGTQPHLPADEAPVVFVHLLGPVRNDGGTVWAGDDAPASGGWPRSGSDSFDRHVLELPPDLPPGSYSLEIGLYNPATQERYQIGSVPGSPTVARADPASRRIMVDGVTVAARSFMSSAVWKRR